jgi:hypothetical protein
MNRVMLYKNRNTRSDAQVTYPAECAMTPEKMGMWRMLPP